MILEVLVRLKSTKKAVKYSNKKSNVPQNKQFLLKINWSNKSNKIILSKKSFYCGYGLLLCIHIIKSTNHLGKNDGPYFKAYVLDNSRNLVNIIWC